MWATVLLSGCGAVRTASVRRGCGVRGRSHWYLAPQGPPHLSLTDQEFSSEGLSGSA